MTSQRDFLEHLIKTLDAAGIAYMICGSMGSSFHGYPRATNDADIVIDATQEQVLPLVSALEHHCYINRQAVLDAVKNRSMFNVIDVQQGWKADLMVRKDRAFSKQEFSRRRQCPLMGMNAFIVSPEDSILSKLEWAKGRLSQMQFNDALGVLRVQGDRLDMVYLKKWASELGVQDDLEKLLKEA